MSVNSKNMDDSMKVGLSFGLTSAVITTLGLMVGLNAGTHSKLVVIGGIITIAVADAFSDSLGIHISEEARGKKGNQIWASTISTWVAKFVFAMTFVVPVLLLELETAIYVSIAWGLLLLAIYSYYIAKQEKIAPYKVIGEHLLIAVVVIVLTNFIGGFVSTVFS